ncbi:hypothetical protein FFJ24_003535 [Pedobacter sp. KBS0701]|uniref:hypothetical protein n=1 Tax=Pedobacter sp. KBS0701 TaxID=2578106 RepID=UPI00110E165D|nr:hypothetical protein [Pedobacter sp. KBS0701]QDW23948.1 hypothetical protein FFJ24_003535 [Pedobacter sp. KBS0701]
MNTCYDLMLLFQKAGSSSPLSQAAVNQTVLSSIWAVGSRKNLSSAVFISIPILAILPIMILFLAVYLPDFQSGLSTIPSSTAHTLDIIIGSLIIGIQVTDTGPFYFSDSVDQLALDLIYRLQLLV